MRVIKFRAWDEKLKKMFPVVIMRWDDSGKPDTNMILMQSTGLHDKNGKEIYEGDILSNEKASFRGGEPSKYVEDGIEYDDTDILEVRMTTAKGVTFHYYGGESVNTEDKESIYWLGEMEVIGSIYENPELAGRTE